MAIMRYRILAIFLCLSAYSQLYSQKNLVRQAQAKIEKSKWTDAKALLQKAIQKDSTHVESLLTLATWYYSKSNPSYHLDSAYRYVIDATTYFDLATSKQQMRLVQNNISLAHLKALKNQLDSAAFEHVKQTNTEAAYTYFISTYLSAKQRAPAAELRDEIGFANTLKINSMQGFEKYLQAHPNSKWAEEAAKKYHQLLYTEKTLDGKLNSFQHFVREFPESPYLNQAEKEIFELVTADGSTDAFITFLKNATRGKSKSAAQNILYHLLLSQEKELPDWLLTDSLKKITQLNKGHLIPFLQDHQVGFLDSLGHEVLPPQFELADQTALCENYTHDIIFTTKGIFNRQGVKISNYYPIMHDIGHGFIAVGDSSCLQLLHKSGAIFISTCHQEFNTVGSFISARSNQLWGIYTFTGRPLLSEQYDKIELIQNVYVLTRLGKKTLVTAAQLAACADKSKLNEEMVFDEVHSVSNELLAVRTGALEGIINQQLVYTVPLDRQNLTVTSYGLIRRINGKYSITGLPSELDKQSWDNVKQHKQWLVLTANKQQQIVDLLKKELVALRPDSVWFEKGLLFAREGDSTRILINSNEKISVPRATSISFVPSKDSVYYFSVNAGEKKVVHNAMTGKKIFSIECSKIESLSRTLFLITKKNKLGLAGLDGKTIVPSEFDAIVKLSNRYYSLLKSKKFGLFDALNKTTIKPEFDQNLSYFDEKVFAVNKAGLYGLINWRGQPLTKLEFDEIQFCDRSLVWLRTKNNWMLFDYTASKVILDRVDRFQLLTNQNQEIIYLVNRSSNVGVYSSIRGLIIPITFSYIKNVGSEDYPLYLTDKEVKEASLHVVIYYNQAGKFIRKQVYEVDEFERLICEDD